MICILTLLHRLGNAAECLLDLAENECRDLSRGLFYAKAIKTEWFTSIFSRLHPLQPALGEGANLLRFASVVLSAYNFHHQRVPDQPETEVVDFSHIVSMLRKRMLRCSGKLRSTSAVVPFEIVKQLVSLV